MYNFGGWGRIQKVGGFLFVLDTLYSSGVIIEPPPPPCLEKIMNFEDLKGEMETGKNFLSW